MPKVSVRGIARFHYAGDVALNVQVEVPDGYDIDEDIESIVDGALSDAFHRDLQFASSASGSRVLDLEGDAEIEFGYDLQDNLALHEGLGNLEKEEDFLKAVNFGGDPADWLQEVK
jgi:hypothetical protein